MGLQSERTLMSKRGKDWNEGLANDLRRKEFAREFILAASAEGISLQAVLGKIIRAYGVKEFAAKIKMPTSNVLRTVNPKSNPTVSTLNKLLRPFGLQLSVSPIATKRKLAA